MTKKPVTLDAGERMSPNFAVFNAHINNAGARAEALMKEFFPGSLKTFKAVRRKQGGVMGIFNEPPSPATMLYVGLVTAFVNERPIDTRTPAEVVADTKLVDAAAAYGRNKS